MIIWTLAPLKILDSIESLNYSNVEWSEIKEYQRIPARAFASDLPLKTLRTSRGNETAQPSCLVYLSPALSTYAVTSGKTSGMSFGITENALYAATARCGTRAFNVRGCTHGRVEYAYACWRAHVHENLIQNAAKRGLILCTYPYGDVRAENTRFYRRINERQGYIRASTRERIKLHAE